MTEYMGLYGSLFSAVLEIGFYPMKVFAAVFAAVAFLPVADGSQQTAVQEKCSTIDTSIKGDSMQGTLNNGQKITVYLPACGKPARYDHLLFTNEETGSAVVKQIWGMPGDTVEVLKKNRLFINGVLALTPLKKRYVLLGFAKKRMKRLEGKPLEGYLVLGHPGSLDSARVGVIAEKNMLGYVKRDQPYVEK
ncbi:MAG: signal peptidase I [Kordiimonadales bacterium]|nr:MAG: signal peptidase I [Kordiimonadales bacterium]